MLRRYTVASALIMAVSLASAGLANAASSKTTFNARCIFQVYIHLSRAVPQVPDHAKFIASLGLQQISTAFNATLFKAVAMQEKVLPSALQGKNVAIVPSPGLATFTAVVVNPKSETAIRLTNAVCQQTVAAIKTQRAAQTDAQLKDIKARIPRIQAELKRLEGIPATRRTAADTASLRGQRAALTFNAGLIAETTSLPPDDVRVLAPAVSATRATTGSLSRNLVIAIVAGLLACFLYILVGEILVERRRSRQSATS